MVAIQNGFFGSEGSRLPATIRGDKEVALFLELCHDLVCVLDGDGYFDRLNARWKGCLGWRPSAYSKQHSANNAIPAESNLKNDSTHDVHASPDTRGGPAIQNRH